MTRIIGVLAGKGGVGKTTLSANLTYALADLGMDVIAIDANMTTPHLGLHFGTYSMSNTLQDVLKGRARLNSAIYNHPYGFKFIPASMSLYDLTGVNIGKLPEVSIRLLGQSDFVIVDCAPSLGREALSGLDAVDEVILVVTPSIPSVVDAMKTLQLARSLDKRVLGVVVNRSRGSPNEMRDGDIEEMMEAPIIAKIPEDIAVLESISAKKPVIEYAPNSSAAIEINDLAHRLVGRKYSRPIGKRLFGRFSNLFRR